MLVIPLLKILYVDILKLLILSFLFGFVTRLTYVQMGLLEGEEQLNLLTLRFVSETKGHQRFHGFKNYTYFTYCFEMLYPFG